MKRIAFLVVAVLLMPSVVLAQAAPRTVEDKKAVTFKEVERGFFFEVNGGLWATINPPASADSRQYFTTGQAVQIEIGYDIGERISPALFFHASASRMGTDYTGLSHGTASGDFSTVCVGASLKARLLGFDDSQEVKRTWIYVHAAGGFVAYSPGRLIPTSDVLISAGPGVEYFTRLRHFSVGIEADFTLMASTGSVGFSVLPTVRYAF